MGKRNAALSARARRSAKYLLQQRLERQLHAPNDATLAPSVAQEHQEGGKDTVSLARANISGICGLVKVDRRCRSATSVQKVCFGGILGTR